jgi:hypothetical protein
MQTTFWYRPCGSTPSGPQHDVARRSAVWTGCVGWQRGRALRDSGATRFKREFNAQRWETHLHCTHVAYETTRDTVGLGRPVERFLARTGRCDWRWVCSMFQMAEELADHLALRDGGNDPQSPALAKRAAGQNQRKHPLEQPRPAPGQ